MEDLEVKAKKMGVDAKEKTLLIQGPSGKLEVRLQETLEPAAKVNRIGVVCHPHPLYQGTMDNKVVTTIARAWSALGLSTVRFNFRGVGQSEGEYAKGEGEKEDLKAVLDWLQSVYPNAVFWLGGFSFGAYIAISVAAQGSFPIQALLAVAPPVQHFPIGDTLVPKMPMIVIQGDQDEVVPYSAVQHWYDTMQKLKANITFITLKDASHFFHGRLIELKSEIIRSMEPLLKT